MNYQPEHKYGSYIPLGEYVADIKRFRSQSPWRLPLGFKDRLQLWLLARMVSFSWFAPLLHIKHPYPWGPAYTFLIEYLRKKQMVDELSVRTLLHAGFYSFYAERRIMKGSTHWQVIGHGVSKDRQTALSKTLGEILERTISGLGDENQNITSAAPEQLSAAVVPMVYPPRYHRYLPVQIATHAAKLQHDPRELLEWVTGVNLITHQPTLIPKHMTSWFYGNRLYKNVLQHPTSNGCAGYFTKEGATLRALLEVVQRDAILTHWLTKTPPRQIVLETLPGDLRVMVRDSERIGISVKILDITSLGIPTVCVVAITSQSPRPQVVLSAAAALTFEVAVGSALEELVNLAGIFNEVEQEGDDEVIARADNQPFVTKLSARTRQLYWRGAARLPELQWFLSGAEVSVAEACTGDLPTTQNDAQDLQTCLAVLRSQGEGYYPVAYQPKNHVQDELGFYVSQVFIPKAFPMYLLEYLGTFDSDRLQDFAAAKGISSWTLNLQPHMFS
jgi:thiazole/oxazole-forming peptide maturase SagD family component